MHNGSEGRALDGIVSEENGAGAGLAYAREREDRVAKVDQDARRDILRDGPSHRRRSARDKSCAVRGGHDHALRAGRVAGQEHGPQGPVQLRISIEDLEPTALDQAA